MGTKRANGGPLGSLLSIDNYATNFFWQVRVVEVLLLQLRVTCSFEVQICWLNAINY